MYLSWFTGECLGHEQSKILKEELGVEAFTWRSYVKDFTWDDAEMFSEAIETIRQKQWSFDYIVVPDLRGDQIRDYYLYPEKTFGYSRCAAPFFMVDIMPNGDIVTCRDFIDVKVGNITENHLLEIWNNHKFRAFRKLLIKRGGLLPQCTRCCGLMGF